MESNGSGRRRFLKHAAAPAGVAAGAGAGAEWAARGQTAKPEEQAKDAPSSGETLRRGARMSVNHITYYTPLQDYGGIITPASLHFVQYHASHFPDIDAKELSDIGSLRSVRGIVDGGGGPPANLRVSQLTGTPRSAIYLPTAMLRS
jgi:hypothetical protein